MELCSLRKIESLPEVIHVKTKMLSPVTEAWVHKTRKILTTKMMILRMEKALASKSKTRMMTTATFDWIAIILRYHINVCRPFCKCRCNARWESLSHRKRSKSRKQLWAWQLAVPWRSTHIQVSRGRSIWIQAVRMIPQDRLRSCQALGELRISFCLHLQLSFIRTVLN